MNQPIRGSLRRPAVVAGAVSVVSALTACWPGSQATPAAPGAVVPADKATCEERLIKSIWKGEDLGGAQCSHFLTSDGRAPELRGSSVQTVCERTHIRAILTGEAATPFTQRACLDYEHAYPEARIRRTCRSVSRGASPDLTDVQRSLCMAHIGPLAPVRQPQRPERPAWALATTSSATISDASARRTQSGSGAAREQLMSSAATTPMPAARTPADPPGRVWQEGSDGTRWWTSVNIPPQLLETAAAPASATTDAAVAEMAGTSVVEPEPAAAIGAVPVGGGGLDRAPGATAPADAMASAGATAPADPMAPMLGAAPAAAAAAASGADPASSSPASTVPVGEAPASRVRCEDRYIESIWKGRDTSGPECAMYVAYDGSTPQYNTGRIASVCLGAETRALRSNMPMTAFTLQACLKVLRGRWSPDTPDPIQSTTGADWNTDPADASIRRGLSDGAISSTVQTSWRSIERDCSSVTPPSSPSGPTTKIPIIVTLTVGSSGRVRSAAARAAGNRELEQCIESSVRSWSFPQAVGNTVISVPLSIEPRR